MTANDTGRTLGEFLDAAVARHPDRPYLIWAPDGAAVTYHEMAERSHAAAAAWSSLGVGRGDKVAFLVDNSPEFLQAWFGLARLGAVLVAVNTGFTVTEAAWVVGHSGAEWILAGAEHLATATAVAGQLRPEPVVVGLDGGPPGLSAPLGGVAAPPADVSPDDTISLIYTSGTTGRPKGVVQTHRNFVLTGEAYPAWMGMAAGERVYACLPLFHINSQAYAALGAIGSHGTLVLSPRFSARRFWPEVRRHGANVFNFIGAMTVVLSKKPVAADDADHEVRVAYGVPALPHDLRNELEQRFDLRIISGFGMSETTFGLVEPLDEEARPGSLGRPRHHPDPAVPRSEARIVDGSGTEVPPGVAGELQLRNAAMMAGYFRDPEATSAAFTHDGWFRTGDAARSDEDGFYYFVDRIKDIIRRRGENVSPLEVELVLNEHESVLDSAVIGVPSKLTDEDLFAYVVLRGGHEVEPSQLVEWCRQRLAPFKVPRYVEFLDALPRTSTAKVQKHLLPGLAAAPDRRYDREDSG